MNTLELENSSYDELETKRCERIGTYSYERFHGKETVQLDLREEVQAYINSWSHLHKENIKFLYEDLREEPLSETVSTYIIIPVAAGQDTRLLWHTLEQYAKQDADPSTWSLLLFVNNTITDSSGSTAEIEETLGLIAEFKKQHPQLSVRVTYNSYYDEAPPIGEIRADAWDVAMLDVMQSNITTNNFIGITHDIDAGWISPAYISEMQKGAAENPFVDVFVGRTGWQKDGRYQSDANKLIRYWQYLERIDYYKEGKHNLFSDVNSATRFAIYAAMQGYRRYAKEAETYDLHQRIAIARRLPYKNYSHMRIIPAAALQTNSRRLYQTIAAGQPPDYAWDKFPFLTGEDPIRFADTSELANKPVASVNLEEILEVMESMHARQTEAKARLLKIGRRIIGLP